MVELPGERGAAIGWITNAARRVPAACHDGLRSRRRLPPAICIGSTLLADRRDSQSDKRKPGAGQRALQAGTRCTARQARRGGKGGTPFRKGKRGTSLILTVSARSLQS